MNVVNVVNLQRRESKRSTGSLMVAGLLSFPNPPTPRFGTCRLAEAGTPGGFEKRKFLQVLKGTRGISVRTIRNSANVELADFHALNKGIPLGFGEKQCLSPILGVTNGHRISLHCHFDAATWRVGASRGFDEVAVAEFRKGVPIHEQFVVQLRRVVNHHSASRVRLPKISRWAPAWLQFPPCPQAESGFVLYNVIERVFLFSLLKLAISGKFAFL